MENTSANIKQNAGSREFVNLVNYTPEGWALK